MPITTEDVREALASPELGTSDRVWILIHVMSGTDGGRRRLVAAATIITGASLLAYTLWGADGIRIFVWTLIIAAIVILLLLLPKPK